MENENKDVVLEGSIIKQAIEKTEFDLKEMIKDVAGIASVYEVKTASYDMIIRKLGYHGFTIVYQTRSRDGVIELSSSNALTDGIGALIERKGVVVNEKLFYDISKKYSQQVINAKK